MAGLCRDCRWFRPFRPLSQVVLRDLGADEPKVVEQMLKVMQDERQTQDAEMKMKIELLRLAESGLANPRAAALPVERQMWLARPTMTDHCGLKEREGVYFLHELKNLGGSCKDFKPHDPEPHSCRTCRHRCTGGGEARDRQQYLVLERLALNSAALEKGNGQKHLDEYREFVATTKTLEAAQACYSGRMTQNRPDYLPVCGHKDAVEFTPCAVRNQYDACEDWAKVENAAPAAPPTAPAPAPAVPAMSREEALSILLARPNQSGTNKQG